MPVKVITFGKPASAVNRILSMIGVGLMVLVFRQSVNDISGSFREMLGILQRSL